MKIGDNLEYGGYARLMAEQRPYITVNLDMKDPVELENFVGFFGAISSQFDQYIRANYPDVAPDARFYVKEVRKGSIIVDLFPGGTSDIIQMMDNVVIVVDFAGLIATSIGLYILGKRKEGASKHDLKDYFDTVEAIAKDREGKATIETAIFEEGVWKRRVAFTFTTDEARRAVKTIENHRQDLDRTENADFSRVLMYFRRTDSGEAPVGKRSGERVVIEAISEKDLALIYGSNLAGDRIKDEIRHSIIYERGFIVDVNVQTKGGKPAVYSVSEVRC